MIRACVVALLLLTAVSASAQPTGPYVTGHMGLSGGDGGAAPAAGGSVGYMTPRRIGFELELSVSPGLDFGEGDLFRSRPIAVFSPFPAPTLDFSGRLLTFQTNVVAALNPNDRLRVFAAGGGGVAQLHQDILYRYPDFVFLPDFTSIGLVPPSFDFEIAEQRSSRSESALCLNAGGLVEYGLSGQFALAADARYTHAFFNREGMHGARVTLRGRWLF